MGYVDLSTIQVPTSGQPPSVAWGQQVRDDLEALVRAPKCLVIRTTAFSVAAAAVTPLPLDTVRHQTAANVLWVPGSPTRFTAPIAGVYHYDANIQYTVVSGNFGAIYVRKNGTTYISQMTSTVGNPEESVVSGDTNLAAGDYLEFCAYYSVATTTQTYNDTPFVSMHWIGLL